MVIRKVAGEIGGFSVSASRPLVEGHVRRRVLELPGVEVMERCKATGLVADESGERLTGVRIENAVQGGDSAVLDTDLVMAANGRAGQVPAWLASLGYARPREEKLRVDLLYASRYLRRRPGVLGGDKWVLIGARPGRPRTLVLSAVEGDRWLLTLAGYGSEHHPPSDENGFMAFAASLAPPEVMAAICDAEPLDEIVTHGFPANLRRHYESLDRFPEGLLVTGDAITSFNPLYGQGMTVAALEASALRECLRKGRTRLGPRFLEAATTHIDHAWRMAIGSDLALPEVDGKRPLHVRLLNAYSKRLLKVAQRDAVVASAFRNVIGMLKPPTHLMRPATALRVLRGG